MGYDLVKVGGYDHHHCPFPPESSIEEFSTMEWPTKIPAALIALAVLAAIWLFFWVYYTPANI